MLYLLEDINKASAKDINHLLPLVVRRYEEVFPEWSITVITLEKGKDKNEQIDRIISNLQAIKDVREI